jgi:hypothetical protein
MAPPCRDLEDSDEQAPGTIMAVPLDERAARRSKLEGRRCEGFFRFW